MPRMETSGAELYYEEHGLGRGETTLVLAHGMGGNHAIWFKQLPAFTPHFRVVTFDHRGFGNSSDYTGDGRSAHVADLLALFDHLEIECAHLLGQSMGGGTCISFCCHYPERVRSLVVADSLHALEESAEVAAIMDAARDGTACLEQIERVLGNRMRKNDPTAAILYRQINSFNAVSRFNLAGQFVRHRPEALAATGVPLLFIAGTEDVLFPVTAIRQVVAQLGQAKLVEIPDTGHSAFYESPDHFNQAVLSFLGH